MTSLALAPSWTEPDADAVVELYRRHLSRGRAKLASMIGGQMELRSSGARVVGTQGRSFLDRDARTIAAFFTRRGVPVDPELLALRWWSLAQG